LSSFQEKQRKYRRALTTLRKQRCVTLIAFLGTTESQAATISEICKGTHTTAAQFPRTLRDCRNGYADLGGAIIPLLDNSGQYTNDPTAKQLATWVQFMHDHCKTRNATEGFVDYGFRLRRTMDAEDLS